MQAGLADFIAAELAFLKTSWPHDLPRGVIHADLFPDNVLFLGERVSGLIDFYFACDDFLAYDLAVCLNAWCFEPDMAFNITKGMALINAYENMRRLDVGRDRRSAGSRARRGNALCPDTARRLAECAARRFGQAERSARLCQAAALPSEGRERARLRAATVSEKVSIWTDGACSGNPGPGGWGAILVYGGKHKELSGGEPATTNNRMELMAAIQALEALTRPCDVDLYTNSAYLKGGITQLARRLEAQWLEDSGPQARQKRRTLAKARRCDASAQDPMALGQGPCQ